MDGNAGDRFAVRNSGSTGVIESVGLHACEYMSGGCIWILGETKGNLGAGMSGGMIYMRQSNLPNINSDYVKQVPIHAEDYKKLLELGQNYFEETGSVTMKALLDADGIKKEFIKLIPRNS